jgi:hypothetical protein
MTDINKAIRDALNEINNGWDYVISDYCTSKEQEEQTELDKQKELDDVVAKIKALVVEELIKEIELIDDKLYDLNKSDWGIPTKWSNEKYKGENYADLWTPNEAIHELIRGRLGEIRTIYQ